MSEKTAISEGTDKRFRALYNAVTGCISEKTVIAAIDGRCASGKTTLASLLAGSIDCNVFHCDDFFLPVGMRTKERLAQAGGNLHYERLLSDVLQKIKAGEDFTYRAYDCGTASLGREIKVSHKHINIIEGSYACHPALWDWYTLRIFSDVDKETQRKRILARNPDTAFSFFGRWVPLEEAYFSKLRVMERCDLII